MLTVPQPFVLQGVGHVLLGREMSVEIVGIFISVTIAELLHERGGRIAKMERNGLIARAPNQL